MSFLYFSIDPNKTNMEDKARVSNILDFFYKKMKKRYWLYLIRLADNNFGYFCHYLKSFFKWIKEFMSEKFEKEINETKTGETMYLYY